MFKGFVIFVTLYLASEIQCKTFLIETKDADASKSGDDYSDSVPCGCQKVLKEVHLYQCQFYFYLFFRFISPFVVGMAKLTITSVK